jgi:hypothetical protein
VKATIKGIKILSIVLMLGFTAIQLKRPDRTNPPINLDYTLEAHAQVTPQVSAILSRACADCHSDQTRWPWYSNVAPVSWIVSGHVVDGRRSLNFSEWDKPNQNGKKKMRPSDKLQEMCFMTQGGAMPLDSYTMIHKDAKLSSDDIQTLCDWTERERERLAKNTDGSKPPPKSN